MPAWLLKLVATLLTAASAAGSAVFVSGHLKNAAAPLHPLVAPTGGPLSRFSVSLAAPASGDDVQVQPAVQPMGDPQPVSSTYVS